MRGAEFLLRNGGGAMIKRTDALFITEIIMNRWFFQRARIQFLGSTEGHMGVVVFSGGSVAGAQPWARGSPEVPTHDRREVPNHDVFDVCWGGQGPRGTRGGCSF